MSFAFFISYFPELGQAETKRLFINNGDGPFFVRSSGVPQCNIQYQDVLHGEAEYEFIEMFCKKKNCDCRSARFFVYRHRSANAPYIDRVKPDAIIAYQWRGAEVSMYDHCEPPQPNTVELSTDSPKTVEANAILDLFSKILFSQRRYMDRIKKHYAMMRNVIDTASDVSVTKTYQSRNPKNRKNPKK